MENIMIKLPVAYIMVLLSMGTVNWYCNSIINGLADELSMANRKLTACVEDATPISYKVTATMYQAIPSQTDETPNITADGTRLHRRYAGKYRYIAVSRELLKENGGELEYGDYVIVSDAGGRHNGIWQVKDTMHTRFFRRIDFLCNYDDKPFKYDNVIVTKIGDTDANEESS